jgi:hypothetical protein
MLNIQLAFILFSICTFFYITRANELYKERTSVHVFSDDYLRTVYHTGIRRVTKVILFLIIYQFIKYYY